MAKIDRNRVRTAFDRQAMEYDSHSFVQKQVVSRFSGIISGLEITPGRILDIGSGTGMLLKVLACRFPDAELFGIDLAMGMVLTARKNLRGYPAVNYLTADAEALPFKENTFDLAVSTSTFQWLETLDTAFQEAFRVLAPGGRFVFSLLGDRTLFELRASYRSAWRKAGRGPEIRTHDFHSAEEVEAAMARGGFGGIRVFAETEVEYHRDIPSLLRSLRRIGAGNAAPSRCRGLGEKKVMTEMMEVYRRDHCVDGLIPATYEVIYGMASIPPGEPRT